MRKIYIAGFDVFSPKAKQIGEKLKKACRRHGFIGLYPLDNDAPGAKNIFLGNLKMIDGADFVVANLNNFRGLCMDDGTAFEIGYAFAKGKKIYGYIDDSRSLQAKIGFEDNDGYIVEDFRMPVNLMIGCATEVIVEGNFEECIELII